MQAWTTLRGGAITRDLIARIELRHSGLEAKRRSQDQLACWLSPGQASNKWAEHPTKIVCRAPCIVAAKLRGTMMQSVRASMHLDVKHPIDTNGAYGD